MLSLRSKIPVVLFLFLVLFFALDRLFDFYIFQHRNVSGWDSFRWYNFEYHFRSLERKYSEAESARPVIFIGSSIAKYSVFLPAVEQSYYEKTGEKIPFEILSHASMLPEDAWHYAKRLRRINPRLIVYITNPADLDLERYLPLWEAGPDYDRESHIDYLKIRLPPNLFYPYAFVKDRYKYQTVEQISSDLFRAPFQSIKWADHFYDAILYSSNERPGRLKSYLYYQGVFIPEGLWKNGQTASRFRFHESAIENQTLYFEVTPELFYENLTIKIFTAEKPYYDSGIKELFESGGVDWHKNEELADTLKRLRKTSSSFLKQCDSKKEILSYNPKKIGWQNIKISVPSETGYYCVVLSDVVIDGKRVKTDNKDSVVYGRGLRLPGNFGKSLNENDYLIRRRSLEDQIYSEKKADEYWKEYLERIQPDNWRQRLELGQFNRIRLSKTLLNWHDYNSLEQVEYLNRIAAMYKGKLVIINNPENPVESIVYAGSPWYKGLQNHYQEIVGHNDFYFNFSDMLPANSFGDPHHLTYDASLKMADLYSDAVDTALNRSQTK